MIEFFNGIGELFKQEARGLSFRVRNHTRRNLTPIELEEASQAERRVRSEAYILLGNQDRISMTDQKGRGIAINGSKQLEKEQTLFTGANLLVSISERKNIGNRSYFWTQQYPFYPNLVYMYISKTIIRGRKTPDQDTIMTQANAKDLTALLVTLKESKPAPQEELSP